MEKLDEYQVYDVILNGANEISIKKYHVVDEAQVNSQGRREVMRNFSYDGFEMPEDLSSRINELREEGFIDMNQFYCATFDVSSPNPFVNAKIMLLGAHHKLLEKIYTETIDHNNICKIETYITYVHMKTGDIFTMKVANLGVHSDELIKTLKENGYKYITDSYAYQQSEHLEQRSR